MSTLQENLDAILEDKNTNLLPEVLAEGRSCLGVKGTLRHWVPPEIKIVDLSEYMTGYPYTVDRDSVFFIVEGTQNKVHVIRKSDKKHFELENSGSVSNSNYAMIWPKSDGHWLYVGDTVINEYDEEFNFVSTIYTHTAKMYPYYTSSVQEADSHIGEYRYGRHLILLTYTGTSGYFYNDETNELFTIDFPMTSTSYYPFLVDDNTLCYWDRTNKKLYTYDITEKTLTSEDVSDFSSYSYTGNSSFEGVSPVWYTTTSSTVKIKLTDGTWQDIGKKSSTFVHNDTEVVWLTNDSTAKTATVFKCNLSSGEITQLYQYTEGTITIYGDMPIILYNSYLYIPAKPIRVDISDGTTLIGTYEGTGDIWCRQVGDEVLHYDDRHFYRLEEDGTLTTLLTVPDTSRYTIGFNRQYEFVSGTNSFILLYNVGRNMFWQDPYDHICASCYIYNKTNKTITSYFPYDGGVTLPFDTSGNGIEFSLEVHPDLENDVIHICVVPSIGGMTYGRFIGPIYDIVLKDNSWSAIANPIYSGPNIGGDYMYIGPNIVSNGTEQFEIDQWKEVEESGDYWNFTGCVYYRTASQLLFAN